MLPINEQNFNQLVFIIKDAMRHPDYDNVVGLADLYRMCITGKDDDAIYRRFYKKFAESEDKTEQALYEQLKRITNLILKPVTNRILQPFNKVPRSNAKSIVLQYTGDESGSKINEFQEILDKFWGTKSFNDWMESRFLELSGIDPNSWVVIEFPETDGTVLTTPYPFEIKSKDAIYFEYINNILQYLVCKEDKQENGVEYNAYTLYGQNSVIKLSKVDKNRVIGLREEVRREEDILTKQYHDKLHYLIGRTEILELQHFVDLENSTYVMINEGEFYLYEEFTPHNLGYVNAFRIGYIRDNYTDGRTFVNCFDVAMPYLLNTVKVSCEKDLSFALHVFGKRYEYEQPCRAEGCNGGHLSEGGICSSCHGTGVLTMSSTMEVVKIPLPNNAMADQILDLSKMSYTDRPGTDIIEIQLKYIDSLVEACLGVVFNSDAYIRPTIKETATGELVDQENTYDALAPFAQNYAQVWNFGVNTIATIVSKDDGLMVKMSFGNDFAFETRLELIRRYKLAKEAGVSQDILSKIESKIVRIDNADNPDEYNKWSIKKIYNPFYGKSQEEIALQLASAYVSNKSKVLYSNFGLIWDNLEAKVNDLYKLNKTKIKALLDAEIELLKKEIDDEKPKTAFNVSMPDEETVDNTDDNGDNE